MFLSELTFSLSYIISNNAEKDPSPEGSFLQVSLLLYCYTAYACVRFIMLSGTQAWQPARVSIPVPQTGK